MVISSRLLVLSLTILEHNSAHVENAKTVSFLSLMHIDD